MLPLAPASYHITSALSGFVIFSFIALSKDNVHSLWIDSYS